MLNVTYCDVDTEGDDDEHDYSTEAVDSGPPATDAQITERAAEDNSLDNEEKAAFTTIYEQIADVTKDLSPADLMSFTEHALHQLNFTERPAHQLNADEDAVAVMDDTNIKQRDVPLDPDYSNIELPHEWYEATNPHTGKKERLKRTIPGPIDIEQLNVVDQYIVNNYSSIVGSLIYISITARPDLAFAIGKISRGMHQPNLQHVAMLRHTLGYLRKTQYLKMVYKRTGNAVEALFREIGKRDVALATLCGSDQQHIDPLGGFTDSNFANFTDEQRKSISGYCFFLFGCLVSWRSKLQTLTAASTFEAELIALSFAGNEALWIRKLMGELRFALPSNINIRSKAEPDADATATEIVPDSVL